jgi:hypothetical protein
MKLLVTLGVVLGAVLSVVGAVTASTLSMVGAGAAPSSQLVFDGEHAPASFETPSGLQHEGPFTSSSPFCPSGTAKDVASLGDDMATRMFTCNGSGAQFTARVGPLVGEHGGHGTWRIVDGTGVLADFRGMGTWQSIRTGGDPTDPSTIRFRATWQGVADMDAAPPTIALARATVQKLKRPAGTYRVNLRLAIADANGDANGDAVSYTLSLTDARNPLEWLASKRGQTSTGTVSLAIRVKPAKMTRALRLKVDATDAVGNQASFTRSIRLA